MLQPKYGIIPDRLYTENDLDELREEQNLPIPCRPHRDRLRRQGKFPRPAKITPGRNSTLGQIIIDLIDRRIAEAAAATP